MTSLSMNTTTTSITTNFCTSDDPCEVDEGDCDVDWECKSNLFCGSNNCPVSLNVSSEVDCCEPKGKPVTINDIL